MAFESDVLDALLGHCIGDVGLFVGEMSFRSLGDDHIIAALHLSYKLFIHLLLG